MSAAKTSKENGSFDPDNAALAMTVPCPKCEVPDSWYTHVEDGKYIRFYFKCYSCQHEWNSFRK
jgi:hypothetical protein